MFEALRIEDVQNQISEFDKMKFIDEDGVEKISGRDLSKALGYTEWRNFQKAVNRANEQLIASGKDESYVIVEVTDDIEIKMPNGGVATRTMSDYHLTRKQAINVANNADTSKPGVALVQEWLYDTSAVGEKAINIFNKMNDRRYIENRSSLSLANKCYSATCIDHNVEAKDLGIAHNECDKSLYHKSTEEIKEEYGKSNRPKADFIGADMCLAEAYAKKMSAYRMNKDNADGLDECVAISKVAHEKVRNDIIENSGYTPEQLITGEDIKKVERRYNKLTAEQLKAIEQEF